jgi:hypothetical protein
VKTELNLTVGCVSVDWAEFWAKLSVCGLGRAEYRLGCVWGGPG